jgi:hypothetical protein
MQITAPQLHLHILLIQLVGLKKNWNSSSIAPSSISAGGLNKNSSHILMLGSNENSNSSSILPILLQSHQQNVKKMQLDKSSSIPLEAKMQLGIRNYTHRYILAWG